MSMKFIEMKMAMHMHWMEGSSTFLRRIAILEMADRSGGKYLSLP